MEYLLLTFRIPIGLLKNDYNTKFHLYSLKVSANVKSAMQCIEIFGGENAPHRLCACLTTR